MNQPRMKNSGSTERSNGSERRVFLKVAIGAAGCCYAAAIGYPVYKYLASPIEKAEANAKVTEVTLPDAQKLATGSALMFKFGTRPCLLIHHADGTWVALSAVCSHLGCTVQYQAAQNRIFCACHGGVYDPKTGANVSGPPPKPLNSYKTTLSEKGIVVTRA
jgi:cytochrome b6-f complex iron-sulfur subunit